MEKHHAGSSEDTQISSGELRPTIARMKDTDPATGKTLFQAQFGVNLKLPIILIIPCFIPAGAQPSHS